MQQHPAQNTEFYPLAYMPGFEINRQGQVRNAATGQLRKLKEHPSNPEIHYMQGVCADGLVRSSQVNVLLEETFGPGAAEAAGLPAPDWARVRQSRAQAARARKGLKQKGLRGNKRPCHDCGKPITNYRCSACWAKLRGFAEASDIVFNEDYGQY